MNIFSFEDKRRQAIVDSILVLSKLLDQKIPEELATAIFWKLRKLIDEL